MGLFTLHKCCVSRSLNFFDSQKRSTIPEFSGIVVHCKYLIPAIYILIIVIFAAFVLIVEQYAYTHCTIYTYHYKYLHIPFMYFYLNLTLIYIYLTYHYIVYILYILYAITVITRKLWNRKTIFRRKLCFKQSNKHEAQRLCSVNRPISNQFQVKLFAVKKLQLHYIMS